MIKILIIYILIYFTFFCFANSQSKEIFSYQDEEILNPTDEVDLDSLLKVMEFNEDFDEINLDSLLLELEIEEDFEDYMPVVYYSRGFFPKPNKHFFMTDFFYHGGFTIDDAINVTSSSIFPTKNPFASKNPLSIKERKVRKLNQKNSNHSKYPESAYSGAGISISYTYNIPLIFRIGYEINKVTGLLFSLETGKEFLSNKGEIKKFKETSIIEMREWQNSISIGATIPIWGAFAKYDVHELISYYYLYGGLRTDYLMSTRMTQFMQISTHKDELRYRNGRDTIHLQTNVVNPLALSKRQYLETALGMIIKETGSGLGLGVSFSLHYVYPFDEVLKGTAWKQHIIFLRTSIAFDSFFRK